jgi:hypothetical protein
MELFINIPTGEIVDVEPNVLACRLHTQKEVDEEDDMWKMMEDFWNLVSEKLPSLHFIVDSEECDNLAFLDFITQWFNRDNRTKSVSDNLTRIIETKDFGNFVLVNDCGFTQFRCPSFTGLQELYKFFVQFDAEKHLNEC